MCYVCTYMGMSNTCDVWDPLLVLQCCMCSHVQGGGGGGEGHSRREEEECFVSLIITLSFTLSRLAGCDLLTAVGVLLWHA